MAYAALTSLANILDQILHPHPYDFSLHDKQQIESLHDKVCFLQESLESDSLVGDEALVSLPLQTRIRDAAHEAEDIIESGIHNHFLLTRKKGDPGKYSSIRFTNLEQIIHEIGYVNDEVTKINNDRRGSVQDNDQPRNSPRIVSSSSSRRSHSGNKKTTMVGFGDDLLQIKEKLTSQQYSGQLQIIPIVGMGGVGKTTLARNVCDDPFIVHHFDICAWTTVSQNYQLGDVLLDLLSCTDDHLTPGMWRNSKNPQLRETLYRSVMGRRYLIVMDDVWSERGWDELKMCFPDNSCGSRILLTTRLGNVASYVNPDISKHHNMHFLTKDQSWKLLHEKVFGEDYCPSELKDIGKRIAQKCQGFPLAVVTIGGLLSQANRTLDFWKNVAENLSSVALKDEGVSDILMLSYNYLPHHLKACFLYMGLFPEDTELHASRLIKLWVAEGFIKPDMPKTVEKVAEECLWDLVERNLIFVLGRGSNGNMKTCIIHDLLRDLCVRIGQMEKFLCITDQMDTQNIIPTGRRLLVLPHTMGYYDDSDDSDDSDDIYDMFHCFRERRRIPELSLTGLPPEYLSNVRSFASPIRCEDIENYFFRSFKLIKVFDAIGLKFYEFPEELLELVNLRYLALTNFSGTIPPSISSLWNLQTLWFNVSMWKPSCSLPLEIWEMARLRNVHVKKGFLPNPIYGQKNIILEGLQTITELINFRFSEGVIDRIPNLKKLKLFYDTNAPDFELAMSSLHNLVLLGKVETLRIICYMRMKSSVVEGLALPQSLRKLTLRGCRIPWEYMTVIGSLPNLEVLKLESNAIAGQVWEPVEDQFYQLKFLLLSDLDLEEWRAESSHFPLLKHLVVDGCRKLKEIPLGIGEIPTLERMVLLYCGRSAAMSAKKIQNEQLEFGNDGLQVRTVNLYS